MFEKDVVEFTGTYYNNALTYGTLNMLLTKRTYQGDFYNSMADG